MSQVFGEVAALYDDARPAYPAADLRAALLEFTGGPAQVVEIGAGTGKGTEVFSDLGAPLIAVEPDARMAAVLRERFPDVEVVASTFEEFVPRTRPDLLACALAWHWLDPGIRHRRAFDMLAPGGTLAIVGRRYEYHDPALQAAVNELFDELDPAYRRRDKDWIWDDVNAAGLWTDIEERGWHEFPEMSRERLLALHETFGPYRKQSPEARKRQLDGVGALVGDSAVLDLSTTVVLARRP